MSFLSSVREAASAGLKMAASMASGTSLPFEQGPQITSYQGIMKMYSGKRENKEGVKEIVSIFMYDLKNKKSDEELALVKNAQRRLRTIKHPYLLRCIDAGEQLDNKGGGIIWIVTEPVQPLEDVIDNLREAPGSIAWGTYTLAAAIKFLNIDCNIVHGQVCLSSLFVDKGMDWKLGGFELLVTAPGRVLWRVRQLLQQPHQRLEHGLERFRLLFYAQEFDHVLRAVCAEIVAVG